MQKAWLSAAALLCSTTASYSRVLLITALRDAVQRICLVMRSALMPSLTADAPVKKGAAKATESGSPPSTSTHHQHHHHHHHHHHQTPTHTHTNMSTYAHPHNTTSETLL